SAGLALQVREQEAWLPFVFHLPSSSRDRRILVRGNPPARGAPQERDTRPGVAGARRREGSLPYDRAGDGCQAVTVLRAGGRPGSDRGEPRAHAGGMERHTTPIPASGSRRADAGVLAERYATAARARPICAAEPHRPAAGTLP